MGFGEKTARRIMVSESPPEFAAAAVEVPRRGHARLDRGEAVT